MATEKLEVSPDLLELISTESFAQNISNFRSLLLKFQREIKDGKADGKRAALINREIVGMNRIIGEEIAYAGKDARSKGVPPDALEDVVTIYKATIQHWTDQLIVQYSYIFGTEASAVIEMAQKMPFLPDRERELVQLITECQRELKGIASDPENAYKTLPPFLHKTIKLAQLWEEFTANQRPTAAKAPTTGGPPIVPPATPSSPGDNDPMEARIKALEVDMRDGRDRLIRVETKIDALATKEDLKGALTTIRDDLNGQTWKLVTFVFTFGGVLAAGVFYIARSVPIK